MAFRKSTRSGNAGSCVEVDLDTSGRVLVRDSKDRTGPVLHFNDVEWRAFVGGVLAGEFGEGDIAPV